jgi:uronate dehydrogenase
MKRILLTGAAGGVAGMLRPFLRADYRVRLSDRGPVAGLAANEEDMPAELSDMASVRAAVAGTDAIVHLGAYPVETDWETILASNIIGARNVFEAARLEGVQRIVFASTNHVVGFYRRSDTIPVDVTVRPDTRYGLSKAFGEALGSQYAFKYGLSVLSIRIGFVGEKPGDVRRLSIWVSPRDLYQLVRIGLEAPGIRHEIVYGMSDNKRAWWDNANAFRLGYRPQDHGEEFAAEVLAKDPGPTGDDRIDGNQGGEFCVAETIPRNPSL